MLPRPLFSCSPSLARLQPMQRVPAAPQTFVPLPPPAPVKPPPPGRDSLPRAAPHRHHLHHHLHSPCPHRLGSPSAFFFLGFIQSSRGHDPISLAAVLRPFFRPASSPTSRKPAGQLLCVPRDDAAHALLAKYLAMAFLLPHGAAHCTAQPHQHLKHDARGSLAPPSVRGIRRHAAAMTN